MAHGLDWNRQKERRQTGQRTRDILAANAYVRDLATAHIRRRRPAMTKAQARELCDNAATSHPITRLPPDPKLR